jgi:hypothetical protein
MCREFMVGRLRARLQRSDLKGYVEYTNQAQRRFETEIGQLISCTRGFCCAGVLSGDHGTAHQYVVSDGFTLSRSGFTILQCAHLVLQRLGRRAIRLRGLLILSVLFEWRVPGGGEWQGGVAPFRLSHPVRRYATLACDCRITTSVTEVIIVSMTEVSLWPPNGLTNGLTHKGQGHNQCLELGCAVLHTSCNIVQHS